MEAIVILGLLILLAVAAPRWFHTHCGAALGLLGAAGSAMSLAISRRTRGGETVIRSRGRRLEGFAPRGVPASVMLADGASVPIRPLRPDDRAALRGFLRRLSARSVQLRFFSATPELAEVLARHYDAADGEDRLALVAFDAAQPDRIVAVAECSRDATTDQTEFAVVVADDWQRRGLGLALTRRLLEAARRRGIRRVYGYVLADNVGIHSLLRQLGLPRRTSWESGVQRVELDLDAPIGSPPSNPGVRLRAA